MGQKHLSTSGTSGLASVTDIVEGSLVKQDNGCPVVLPPREDGVSCHHNFFLSFVLLWCLLVVFSVFLVLGEEV